MVRQGPTDRPRIGEFDETNVGLYRRAKTAHERPVSVQAGQIDERVFGGIAVNADMERVHLIAVFADDEDGATGGADDFFGGAAEEHMFQGAVAVGADDDEVGFAVLGDARDFFPGRAVANDGGCGDGGGDFLLRESGEFRGGVFFNFALELF